MRKALMALALAGFLAVPAISASAQFGDHSNRVMRKHTCGAHEAAGQDLGSVNCEGMDHEMEGVTSLVNGIWNEAVCGPKEAAGQDLGSVDCEGIAHQVEGVTSLVDGVACSDPNGAQLDCEGVQRDLRHLERKTAKDADRALTDADL